MFHQIAVSKSWSLVRTDLVVWTENIAQCALVRSFSLSSASLNGYTGQMFPSVLIGFTDHKRVRTVHGKGSVSFRNETPSPAVRSAGPWLFGWRRHRYHLPGLNWRRLQRYPRRLRSECVRAKKSFLWRNTAR